MDLNLFRQDIKKICLLIAYQQSLSSGQITANLRSYQQILAKKLLPLHRRRFKRLFFYFYFFVFLHIDPSNDFDFCFSNFFCKKSQK
jgi:hypothetical protein